MAEFLVFANQQHLVQGDEAVRTAERERAMELRAAGNLKRLWRRPGRRGWIALWEAADATELHDQLASLPMYPYLEITIEALATHPQER
ncbi:MAG TPA: muconolactone Delta-isomerase family protein [Solirubrobacteraceae bacterium]|nr:muconolactone Delta-isomerase family protein [Solirubrobacteraceae bacterium]